MFQIFIDDCVEVSPWAAEVEKHGTFKESFVSSSTPEAQLTLKCHETEKQNSSFNKNMHKTKLSRKKRTKLWGYSSNFILHHPVKLLPAHNQCHITAASTHPSAHQRTDVHRCPKKSELIQLIGHDGSGTVSRAAFRALPWDIWPTARAWIEKKRSEYKHVWIKLTVCQIYWCVW